MAAGQVLVSGFILFALYYYLLRALGPVKLGIWSVVLATTSVAQLSELGFAGSVTKFVAQYLARDDRVGAASIVETAALTVAGIAALLALPLFFFLRWLLTFFLPPESIADGLLLLPFTILSFWLTAVGSVCVASLDGMKRTDIRSVLMMTASGFHLGLVILLLPKFDLIGLAYAQVLQAFGVLVVSWFLSRHLMPTLNWRPKTWQKARFREMLSYGVNLQFAAIVGFLLDPLTKALLSKFGGLDVVSYYELANRMVLQVRSLLVSANKAVVPFVAGFQESNPTQTLSLYNTSVKFLLFLAIPLFIAINALSPVISILWIGNLEPWFVQFTALLSIAWFVNTMAGPAYYSNLGTGRLRWNTLGHAAMGSVNLAAGFTLGPIFGAKGVIVGMSMAVILGSLLVIAMFHRQQSVSFWVLVPREHILLALAAATAGIMARIAFDALSTALNVELMVLIILGILSVVVLPAVWLHPIRLEIHNRTFGAKSTN